LREGMTRASVLGSVASERETFGRRGRSGVVGCRLGVVGPPLRNALCVGREKNGSLATGRVGEAARAHLSGGSSGARSSGTGRRRTRSPARRRACTRRARRPRRSRPRRRAGGPRRRRTGPHRPSDRRAPDAGARNATELETHADIQTEQRSCDSESAAGRRPQRDVSRAVLRDKCFDPRSFQSRVRAWLWWRAARRGFGSGHV
jgi:hypothetical protein